MSGKEATQLPGVTVTRHRVNYSETDQMGVVYHARYLVWLDVGRTEHLRHSGTSYYGMEHLGLRLAVSEVNVRYRRPARYDEPIRVRTWVRDVVPRRVKFGYAVEHDVTGDLLATASTSLVVLDANLVMTRLPEEVTSTLLPIADPVRL
ncbi:MAG TPA: thioesterase family protein [Gemmatimonadales bacterium]|jgi:acyl-CoA thioester hydrolase|nr:thioesterase family protein [Gemmatimonadales bacterium]